MTTETLSLYDRLGGADAIAAVVDGFYDRVLADARLVPFFAGVNMDRLRGRQTEFLVTALGGPELYTGPSMEQVHAGRGISAGDFAAVAGHLVEALTAAGVEPALVDDVIGVVATLQPAIVGA